MYFATQLETLLGQLLQDLDHNFSTVIEHANSKWRTENCAFQELASR